MRINVLAAAVLLAQLASASPAAKRQTYIACSGLYGTAQCCATDVLGLVDLDCGNPPSLPASPDEFSSVCSAIGQRARCCVLPVLEQGVLCQTPTGVDD
ncbi:unnamed protein product [Clonostachys byssicola]|uniref:Trihydrophobin n=1 Tax=Clonostachys byssicola TaxID=160290 RepID=A0A9N9Y632_9HYPO|nr:unnamed protein product [Clonostachys byssicola]